MGADRRLVGSTTEEVPWPEGLTLKKEGRGARLVQPNARAATDALPPDLAETLRAFYAPYSGRLKRKIGMEDIF